MKKILIFTVILTLVIGGSVVFADTPMQIIESITGKSLDELHQLRKEGKTLADIVEEQGVTEELKQALYDEVKERMDKLVGEGRITQERADEILDRYEARLDEGYFGMPIRYKRQRGFQAWADVKGIGKEYHEKLYETQIEFVKEMLEKGKITQEEADNILKLIELRHENKPAGLQKTEFFENPNGGAF